MPPFLPRRFFGVNHQLSYLMLLLTAALMFCGFVTAKSQEQMSREVKFFVHNMECKEGFDETKNKAQRAAQNYEGWQIKFGEQIVTMDRSGQATATLTYLKDKDATYNVSVFVPNEPKAKLFIIYYNDWSRTGDYPGEGTREYRSDDYANDRRDDDGDGILPANPYDWWDRLSATQPVRQPYMVLGVDDAQCQEKQAKRFSIVVLSEGCKDPNYKDLRIMIGNTEVTNFKVQKNDEGVLIASGQSVELKPGSYEIQASGPGSDTSVGLVEVVDTLSEYGKFRSESKGRAVSVSLDESMWMREAGAALKIYLHSNCADPDFLELKVLAVTGKVEIIVLDGRDNRTGQAKVNDIFSIFHSIPRIIRTDSGGSIILKSEYGHVITIAESTEVQAKLINTASGREELEAFIKMGKIQIKRVRPEPSSTSDESTSMSVRTHVAAGVDFETNYTVSHDPKTNVTSFAVEEGKVQVTPVNTSLKPFVLAANQQVQVSDKSVSAVTHYSGESSRGTSMVFYVGIGAAALLGLLVVVGGITFLYRRVNRAPVQPASQQSGIKVEAAPAKLAAPAVATSEWRCPNPRCGKLIPASKKFCTACGTRSGVKVETTPAYVASPAVATRERRCPNPQCGRIVAARKKFCTACGASVI